MTRILLLVVLLSTPGFPQNVYLGQPWDRLFRQSWIAQSNGEFSKARDLTAEGWKLVNAAGPSAFGYAGGVEQAYALRSSSVGHCRPHDFIRKHSQRQNPQVSSWFGCRSLFTRLSATLTTRRSQPILHIKRHWRSLNRCSRAHANRLAADQDEHLTPTKWVSRPTPATH
jgi:hypothetical protein